jgi:hypothetical protein
MKMGLLRGVTSLVERSLNTATSHILSSICTDMVIEIYLQQLLAHTIVVIQEILPDHQDNERKKLRLSFSIKIYAAPYASRERLYHAPKKLIVEAGNCACMASRTAQQTRQHLPYFLIG